MILCVQVLSFGAAGWDVCGCQAGGFDDLCFVFFPARLLFLT